MATEYDQPDDDQHIVSEVLANSIAPRINHSKLARKIKDRSSVTEMQARGILYDHPSISPGLIDAHRLLEKRRASVKIDNMLQTRPTVDELRRKNILMQESETQVTKREHKRKLSRRLSEKLLMRPAMDELADIIFDAGLKANPEWDEDTMTVNVEFRDDGIDVEYGSTMKQSLEDSEEVSLLREEIEDLKAQIRELEEINIEQRDHMIELRERSHTHTTVSNAGTPNDRIGGGGGLDRDSYNLEDLQQRCDDLQEENFFLQQKYDKALETAERAQAENEKHFEKIQEMTQTITKLMTTRMSFQAQDAIDNRERKTSLAELMNTSQLAEIARAQVRGSNGSVERISELESLPENMQAIAELEKNCTQLQEMYSAAKDKNKAIKAELSKLIDLSWERASVLNLMDPTERKPNGFDAQYTRTILLVKQLFDQISTQKTRIADLNESLEHERREKAWQLEEAEKDREKKRHGHKSSIPDESELLPFSYQNMDAALAALESPEKRKILELEKEIKMLRKSKQRLVDATSEEMERMRSRLNTLTFQLQQRAGGV